MAINLIFFGQLSDIAGANTLQLDGIADTAALQQWLHQRMPALAGLTYRVAVDKVLVNANTPITDGATVALLPPFSGG